MKRTDEATGSVEVSDSRTAIRRSFGDGNMAGRGRPESFGKPTPTMSEANLETRVAILETHVENQKDTLNRIETKLETVSQTLNDITRDFNVRLII